MLPTKVQINKMFKNKVFSTRDNNVTLMKEKGNKSERQALKGLKERRSKMQINPRPDDEYRTQEEAIALHNKLKERMVSIPTMFQLVKEKNTEAIETLRKDFKDRWLVTPIRIIYDPENLSAKIFHDADSEVVKQTEIDVDEVPVCNPTYIKELLDTSAGLDYVRALLNDKKATKEQIISFFVALSGKKEKHIRFWTPDQSSRKNKQVRSVDLCFSDFDWFVVVGSGWFDDDSGYSHGVLSDSEPKARSKFKGKKFSEEEKGFL